MSSCPSLGPLLLSGVLFSSPVSSSPALCPLHLPCVLFTSPVSSSPPLCPLLFPCVLFIFRVLYLSLCPLLLPCILFTYPFSSSPLLCPLYLSFVLYLPLCPLILYCIHFACPVSSSPPLFPLIPDVFYIPSLSFLVKAVPSYSEQIWCCQIFCTCCELYTAQYATEKPLLSNQHQQEQRNSTYVLAYALSLSTYQHMRAASVLIMHMRAASILTMHM